MDSEATAKALLARGQLRNRVTIVPLNKARSASTGVSHVPAEGKADGNTLQSCTLFQQMGLPT